jgi:hypothetical protein
MGKNENRRTTSISHGYYAKEHTMVFKLKINVGRMEL